MNYFIELIVYKCWIDWLMAFIMVVEYFIVLVLVSWWTLFKVMMLLWLWITMFLLLIMIFWDIRFFWWVCGLGSVIGSECIVILVRVWRLLIFIIEGVDFSFIWWLFWWLDFCCWVVNWNFWSSNFGGAFGIMFFWIEI